MRYRVGALRGVEVVDGNPSELDRSLNGLDDARQGGDERRLAASGRADQRDRFAGAHLEIDRAHDDLIVITNRDVAEAQVGWSVAEAASRPGLGERFVKDCVEATAGGPRDRHSLQERTEYVQRQAERAEERCDLNQPADSRRPTLDAPHADQQHQDDAEVGQRTERRLEDGPHRADLNPPIPQLGGLTVESLGLVGLATEQLDHQRPVEALVRDRGHPTDTKLLPVGGPADPPRVDAVDPDRDGEHGQRDQGQNRIDQKHRDRREDRDEAGGKRERKRVQRLGDVLGIGVDVGEQLAW